MTNNIVVVVVSGLCRDALPLLETFEGYREWTFLFLRHSQHVFLSVVLPSSPFSEL